MRLSPNARWNEFDDKWGIAFIVVRHGHEPQAQWLTPVSVIAPASLPEREDQTPQPAILDDLPALISNLDFRKTTLTNVDALIQFYVI